MLILLSPSKTLDMAARPGFGVTGKKPVFAADASALVKILRTLSAQQLGELMEISPTLSALNAERYAAFSDNYTKDNAALALYAFKGDVYTPMQVAEYTKAELAFAEAHVRILSGLYGVLSPMSLMQPYRLEMGTKLKNKAGKDLYAFWKDKVAGEINRVAAKLKRPVIVNLASQEYFKAVDVAQLDFPLLTVDFKEYKSGSYRTIGLMAKRARGMMTNYVIRHALQDTDHLRGFAEEGYRFSESHSKEHHWVFTRKA